MYRWLVERTHCCYKYCSAACALASMCAGTNVCKFTQPETCSNMTFTWPKHVRFGAKSSAAWSKISRSAYHKNCTVNSYNGYITSINISVLHLLSPLCMLKQLCENLHTLEHTATHLFDGLNMAKSHILLNGQFWPAPANRCTDSLVLGIYRQSMSMLSICTSV